MAYWYTGSAFFQIPQSYPISIAVIFAPVSTLKRTNTPFTLTLAVQGFVVKQTLLIYEIHGKLVQLQFQISFVQIYTWIESAQFFYMQL